MKSCLIVGIGNPGEQYKYTRHNAGAIIVKDAIDLRYKLELELQYQCKINTLICCDFVNICGKVVYANICDCVIVVVDDMETSLGLMKFVYPTMGHRGHNGTRDIMRYLGNNFCSVRVGIGRPAGDVSDFVLSNFTTTEMKTITGLVNGFKTELNAFLSKFFYDKKTTIL